ncbi:MAG TPA: MG2 domain-containing protein, partial [Thermoanaerobaculia bacterium]|nr:MG2 domain-containing protein [Thermoanaerobaculia bacterium]
MEKLLGEARTRGDEEAWTRALVQAAGLRESLYKPEDAARFLKEQPRPSGPLYRAVVDLYYSETLVHDLEASAWEIGQREKVESEGEEPPLEQWTREQIAAAALAACRDAWSRRQEMGDAPLAQLRRYLQPNPYPAAIRGTVRDALSYLYTELLTNQALWSPEESVTVDSLDRPALIRGDATAAGAAAVHPLREMAAVLGDLEAWHLAAGRREAALEARRTLLLLLHGVFTDDSDRRLLRRDLEEHLETLRDVPWWSMGMATLADLLQQGEEPGHLARAHAAAVACRDASPLSPGGERCRSIVLEIEAASFQLQAMESDGLGRRSLEVRHKNLPVVYFRAYPADPAQPGAQPRLDDRPVAAWQSELPPTPDFDWHTTWIVPPIDRPGAYTVVASSRADFSRLQNQLAVVDIVLSDLVLLGRDAGSKTGKEVEVLALSGATGEPLAGVEVRLYGTDDTAKNLGTWTTGADGVLRFPLEPGQRYRVLGSSPGGPARLGSLYPPSPDEPDAVSTLLYTDRAIYRPLQTIFWKVLAYQGSSHEGRFGVLTGQKVKVTLFDFNSQEVASRIVTTNGFGTASGEFQIPAGRLLGSWSLRTSMESQSAESTMGSAWFQVEEYKRPTFEVVLDAPAQPLRLGAPAKLTGRAVYYFGLPVTHGQVRWSVTRTPVYPRWYWDARNGSRTVAVGTSAPGADGRFEVAFTPQPETRGRGELTYQYNLSTAVTDEGGET